MKISVVFTGGTIGCVSQDGWRSTNEDTKYLLLDMYREKTQDFETEFIITTPCMILSENLSAKELNTIIKAVVDELSSDTDGVILTHGTDTLLYTSAALSFSIPTTDKAVVAVSSAHPLSSDAANGVDNFIAAVSFIKSRVGSGVYVSYKNTDVTRTNIHIATRLMQYQEASDDLYSIDKEPFAYFYNNKFTLNKKQIQQCKGNPYQFTFITAPKILVIDSRPEDRYNYPTDDISAVIFKPYHSGTLNTGGEKFSSFCLEMKKRNVPMFVVNVRKGESYESTKLYEELGITQLPFCTYVSAYVKCWAGLSMGLNLKEYMMNQIAGEFSD